jgi:hypothetical protein
MEKLKKDKEEKIKIDKKFSRLFSVNSSKHLKNNFTDSAQI